jgi:Replication initiator protein, pSAM2
VSEPVRVGDVLPGVLAEVIDRASNNYDRWAEQVAAAGYCAHPVRLAGWVEQADRQTGELREVYSTETEPDGTLLKACGTRRASRCPSCAAVYQADAYQLTAAGLRGGKGVPETVAAHPRLFVTFTAPSFGPVHTRKAQGRLVLPCHPHRQGRTCPHGRRAGCWQRHQEDDQVLGEPICPDCYDARGQVLWNALSPVLWRYTTTYVDRALARQLGLTEAQLRLLVRVSYVKVAEFQRRGAVHFHAIVRLDAATACRCATCLTPPPEGITAAHLEAAIRDAAAAVRVPCPPPDQDTAAPGLYARWGAELDVRNVTRTRGDDPAELSAEQVAAYLAKYATKGTEGFGTRLDRRIGADDLADLDQQLPAHVAALVRACWELGGRPGLDSLKLRKWAHMLGFRGHWQTKSRRYSTTMTILRRARVVYARRRHREGVPLDAWGRPEDDELVEVVATWAYAGRGYQTQGEAWLALSAAARARERRRIAREELTTTTTTATAA